MAHRIQISTDFSRFPAGRFRSDGPFSGEAFREDLLVPALAANDVIEISLDGAAGYGSSFLDEAFGGLIRSGLVAAADFQKRIRISSIDESLILEIGDYVKEAGEVSHGSST